MKQIKKLLLAGIVMLTAATASMGNTAPVANAGTNQNVNESIKITLDGTDSYDVDKKDKLSYSWSFAKDSSGYERKPRGSTATLSKTTSKRPTFETDKVGSYVIQLIVNVGTVKSAPDFVTIVHWGEIDYENSCYTEPTNTFVRDDKPADWYECTRYAFGRSCETTGEELTFTVNTGRHGGEWYDIVDASYQRGSEPLANSLAVWSYGTYGHVAFVESVDGDNVTISEANWANPLDGLYSGQRTLTTEQMGKRGSLTLEGYVYLVQVPTITLSEVLPIYSGEEAVFQANLFPESLEDKYTVKISLGDGGDKKVDYLDAIEMTPNDTRDSFTFPKIIRKAKNNRVYRVAIFYGDRRVSPWVSGTYSVYKAANIPTITLSEVSPIYLNEEATFQANLSKSLGSEYKVKIALSNGRGGYLRAFSMTANTTRDIFTSAHTMITAQNDWPYGVAIFDADGQVSTWVEGTFTVYEAANIPPTAKANASSTSVAIGEEIFFDASGSDDIDGEILYYKWKIGGARVSEDSSFSRSLQTAGSFTFTLTVTDDDGATASDTVVINVTSESSTSVVKKTGQTKSYDTDGNEVNDDSLKDDGYYQAGVTPSYTRDDEKEVVIDHITGLMWQDDTAVATVTKPWLSSANYNTCVDNRTSSACHDTSGDTAATYCTDLVLGGHTDWRLPSSKELEGIVHYGKTYPAIDTIYFYNLNSYGHSVSSTISSFVSLRAWRINFNTGATQTYDKYGKVSIRCVRDGQ